MSDDAKNQLKAAAEKVEAAEAAKRRKAEKMQEKKNRQNALFLEAKDKLKKIQDTLYEKIKPVSDEVLVSGNKLTFGEGEIEIKWPLAFIPNLPVLGEDFHSLTRMYELLGYEAIAGTHIVVACRSKSHTQSATLLYLKKEKEEQFRWYQVAFAHDPRSKEARYHRAFPFHLEPNHIDIYNAFSPKFHDIIVAYGPKPIDGDDYQNFENLWISVLADAAIGELSQKWRTAIRLR